MTTATQHESIQVTIALAQYAPGVDADANRQRLVEAVEEGARRGADLVLAPEYASFFDGAPSEEAVRAAEPLDGPFVTATREAASQHGIVVVASLVETGENPSKFQNTTVAIGADGETRAVYRKMHLYDAFGASESQFVEAGSSDAELPIFAVNGVSFGIQTCYDLRFPEVTRRLAAAGAEVILMPAQWVPGPLKEHHWNTLIAARAIESTVVVAATDHPMPHGVGLAQLVDASGVVREKLGSGEGMGLVSVDAADIAHVRATNPSLSVRRFDAVARTGVEAQA